MLARLLHPQWFDVNTHQQFQLRDQALCQTCARFGHLDRVGKTVLDHLNHSSAALWCCSEAGINLGLQSLQQTDIGIPIHAAHPAPVPGEAHDCAVIRACPTQQDTDVRELALHCIRNIADEEELTWRPFVHIQTLQSIAAIQRPSPQQRRSANLGRKSNALHQELSGRILLELSRHHDARLLLPHRERLPI